MPAPLTEPKSTRWPTKSRFGSLCLEAALILPFVLLLTAQMISLIILTRIEIVVEASLERTASELSLLSPFCEALADWQQGSSSNQDDSQYPLDHIVDLPGTGELPDMLQNIFPDQDLKPLLRDMTLDLASSALLGQFLLNRFEFWLQDSASSQRNGTPRLVDQRLYLDWKLNGRQLWLCLSWQYRSPLGAVRRLSCSVVPLWIGKDRKAASGEADQVWLMDNFSRGKYLRQLFGGHLPYDFPVIAAINQMEALSIKSADLTAPTYQDASNLADLITAHMDNLAGFCEAHYHRRGTDIDLLPQMIEHRRLLLIIPENSQQAWLNDLLQEMQTLAAEKSIQLQIIRFGRSSRFKQDTDP
jgi:hypothetical protein